MHKKEWKRNSRKIRYQLAYKKLFKAYLKEGREGASWSSHIKKIPRCCIVIKHCLATVDEETFVPWDM